MDPDEVLDALESQRPVLEQILLTESGQRDVDRLLSLNRPVANEAEYRAFVAEVLGQLRTIQMSQPTITASQAERMYPEMPYEGGKRAPSRSPADKGCTGLSRRWAARVEDRVDGPGGRVSRHRSRGAAGVDGAVVVVPGC